ncbi:MAG: radical SAM family heme chaperone HemW [Oscillospiraceae bacterium]|nr:radical SAM family heme chaperone HemW [Oscillospiraceae bacterium]
MPKGLYIHIPFCVRKCPYCDFFSVTDMSMTEAYTDAVVRNIKAARESFDTVYFGGGTPSLLTAEQFSRILSAADICKDAEITTEANPNSVTPSYLRELKAVEFDRISFGVQSFNDSELQSLGRLHTADEAASAINAAHDAGFDNISADLMLAVSGQTRQSLENNLRRITELPLTHISAYMLKVEEGTPLSLDKKALESIPDDDETADMYLEAVEFLERHGFEQYEISNFARDGFECKHNLKYWRCEEYLGIGPSAHSFTDGERYFCPPDIRDFISAEIQGKSVTGSGGDREERAMLALRLTKEGLSLAEYPEMEKPAAALIQGGFLKKEDGFLRLTPQGCTVSNEVIIRLISQKW